MAGHQDRTRQAAERAEALAAHVMERVAPYLEDCVEALVSDKPTPGDLTGIAGRARTAGVLVRTASAVVVLARRLDAPRRRAATEEDELDHRDDSPETLDRMRADLDQRLAGLAAVFAKNGVVARPGAWPVARPDGDALRAA